MIACVNAYAGKVTKLENIVKGSSLQLEHLLDLDDEFVCPITKIRIDNKIGSKKIRWYLTFTNSKLIFKLTIIFNFINFLIHNFIIYLRREYIFCLQCEWMIALEEFIKVLFF